VPARKQDLVAGEYKLDVPKGSKAVAVKIIDMLGEETLIVERP
jgi:adenine-specific DNA-methyltransferase